jgi:PST family polysaccharide transporter
VYLFLVLLMVVTQVRDFFIYVLRAQEKMEREFALIVTESVGTLALVALFLWSTPSIPILGLAYVVGMTFSLICGAWLGRGVFAGSFLGWDSKIVTWLLTNGWSLAIFGVLTSVFFSTDQIMLGRVRSPMEVGLYAVAAKVITLALVVPQVVMVALFPYLMRVAGSRRSRDVAVAMTGLLVLFGIAVGCITYILAPWLIALLGGPEYAQAVPILRNLIWIVVMIFPVTFLDYFLIANGKQVADLVVTGIAAVANIGLAFWLIPLYGVAGAVWATTAGQTLNMLLTAGVAVALFTSNRNLATKNALVREEPPVI